MIATSHYESLPISLREAVSWKDTATVANGLKSLHSVNEEMDCGARVIIEQKEVKWEPRYAKSDRESKSDYARRVLDLSVNERTGPYFGQFISGLTAANHIDYQTKIELDDKVAYLKKRVLTETLQIGSAC